MARQATGSNIQRGRPRLRSSPGAGAATIETVTSPSQLELRLDADLVLDPAETARPWRKTLADPQTFGGRGA